MQGKRGSIALARSLCYEIAGATSEDDIDGNGYGSVDIAEILSAEVERLQKALAQLEQKAEPVAWTTMPEAEDWCFVSGGKDPTGKLEGKWFPLYTTPPQRPWQGLTPDEVKHLYPYGRSVWGRETFEAIEKALKEKNK